MLAPKSLSLPEFGLSPPASSFMTALNSPFHASVFMVHTSDKKFLRQAPPLRIPGVVAAIILAVLAITGHPSVAAEDDPAAIDPMVINADEMTYDRGTNVFTATGNVEIRFRQRIIRADEVIYSEDAGQLTASGNVRIIDPAGHLMIADQMELSADLREGFIKNVLMIFSDGSRLAAVEAQRSNGNRNVLRRAIYSPCRVCVDNKARKPVWSIRAETIIHREEDQTIIYKNAVLEFFGFPVGYLPFLSHPDPTVKRKSGLLVPRIGSSSFLGIKFELPYFFNIAPHRDFTLTPLITSREGMSLAGEYRERTKRGGYTADGSITRVDERDDNNLKTGRRIVRGHIFGGGRFQLDQNTRWGFEGSWTGDDTYLRRYGISDAETLTSRLFIERFSGRDYISASAFGFQGLRLEDDARKTPFVAPWLEYHHGSEPGWRGSRYDLDASLLVMTRPDGFDVRRLSLGARWELPLISRLGTVTRVIASARGDVYHTNSFDAHANSFMNPAAPVDPSGSNVTGRLVPQIAIDWRLPLVRRGAATTQIIEPIVVVVGSPTSGNRDDIPNEDSQSFQFDDTNVFALNRFAGLDRWDAGSRVSYGLRYTITGRKAFSSEIVVGQSYRFSDETDLPIGAGLDDRRSDFVGRLTLGWSEYVEYFHRVRLDKDTLAVRRNEVNLVVGPRAVKFNLGFLETDNKSVDPLNPDRREIKAAAEVRFAEGWSANGRFIRNLLDDKSIIAEGGLFYQDDCIELGASIRRNFTTDRDLTPSTRIIIRLVLKHLG